ncbi:MAG TPA: RING-H2 finger protein, partial [Blastocatellia bacterium]|nr:RING-H2 finger protein [Blastocatellia bacterium]
RREPIPSNDPDVEAQVANSTHSTELVRPSTREEDGIVIIDQRSIDPAIASSAVSPMSSSASSTDSGSASATTAATAGTAPETGTATAAATSDVDQLAMDMINGRLSLIKKTTQSLIILTVLQIMSTLGTEHIHFLSLFSLFVPWTGFEGSKERNFAYLRVFYWGCWIMVPANLFHFMSFEQFVQDILASGNLEENLRRELIFNHTLFNIVTVIIISLMTFCIVWVRQLSLVMRSLRHFADNDFLSDVNRNRDGARAPSGPLSEDEIAAIAAFKLNAQDTASESGDKDVCVICQDDFQANDLVKRLNCRHMFHAQCIDAWLERSSSCPICNGDVRSIV